MTEPAEKPEPTEKTEPAEKPEPKPKRRDESSFVTIEEELDRVFGECSKKLRE